MADHPETAPDPDEDDLDELDDVLDQFADTKVSAPSASGPGRPQEAPSATAEQAAVEEPGIDPAEFEKQLEAGMATLLGEMEKSPEMQEQFRHLMQTLEATGGPEASGAAAAGAASVLSTENSGSSNGASAGATDKQGAGDSFQETIRKTMDRMQESGEQASAAAASSGEDDVLATMLKQIEKGGFGGEGSEEEFSKMLLGMMEQLTNKEILYEPMKELHEKFPKWLEENREKTDKADLERYEGQRTLVAEIVARFERDGYSDDNTEDREYIVERMQKMQAAGSPPAELVGDMNAAQEALGDLDGGCPQQ